MQKTSAAASLQNNHGPKGKTIRIPKPKGSAQKESESNSDSVTMNIPGTSGDALPETFPVPRLSNAAFAAAYRGSKKPKPLEDAWIHKSAAADLRKKSSAAGKQVGELVDEFLFEEHLSDYIAALQLQLHDLAVAEASLDESPYMEASAATISTRMYAIHRSIIFWTKVEELRNYQQRCLTLAQNEEMKFMLAEQRAINKSA